MNHLMASSCFASARARLAHEVAIGSDRWPGSSRGWSSGGKGDERAMTNPQVTGSVLEITGGETLVDGL